MRTAFERLGAASPLVPALGYAAVAGLANLVTTVAPEEPLLLVAALLAWAAAGVTFLIVVIWFRDDDWLAAGFLISVTLLVSAWIGNIAAEVVRLQSVAPVIVGAPAMVLGVMLRGAIGIPIFGGIVALLRRLTRKGRPPRRRAGNAPAA